MTPDRLTVSQLYNKLEYHFWCDKHYQFQLNVLFSYFPFHFSIFTLKMKYRKELLSDPEQRRKKNEIELLSIEIEDYTFARRLDVSY